MEGMAVLQSDLLSSSLSFTSPFCFIEDNASFKCGGGVLCVLLLHLCFLSVIGLYFLEKGLSFQNF